ncbi:MAG: tRNA (adenosine(37)-N6)-dimethylallyltransferase MiaA [Bacteroidales bacterium]|nr:tRNA (adenosine(37)-N6)-dimethylallyltransferase MiaA [Bacteroidales bacterium]
MLVVLVGPTGVGKTELSIRLAQHFHTCIINADSRQLYRELKVGTAAPTSSQLSEVPHYFVGTLSLTDTYSAARYEADVLATLDQLFGPTADKAGQHHVVVLTGGSMMYIDAVCNGIDDIPTVDELTRQTLLQRYREEGLEPLAAELRLLDPAYHAIADIRNPKRVLHALEICYTTGRTYTSFRTRTTKPRPFRIVKVGLTRPRDELYERINQRVLQMVDDGLVEEARQLMAYRALNSLNTVGYKEMFQHIDGAWTLPQAIAKIQQNSRIYSRKQMTWFRRDPDIAWFHPDQYDELLAHIVRQL